MSTCFCEANEWTGTGPSVTLTFRTNPRPVKGGWASTRQVSGYLETCQGCGDRAIVNDDGHPIRFVKDTDQITREA